MLLSIGKAHGGIEIADIVERTEKVHTMTRGRGHSSYRTDGEIVEEFDHTLIPFSMISNMEEFIECIKSPKNTVVPSLEGMYCAIYTLQMRSTAMVVPGSSGGAVLNSDGQLVGIVSATDGIFSAFVRLTDIRLFLSNR
jgi:CBS domain-containing protein